MKLDPYTTVVDTGTLGGDRLAGLNYDCIKSTSRRKAKIIVSQSEDRVLRQRERQVMSTQTRDLLRNFTLAGFAIRKHLQYNSSFSLQCKTRNESLNRQVERVVRQWGHRKKCHIAERHNFNSLMRLLETHVVLDGDVLAVWCKPGKLQIIEADRIRDPRTPYQPELWKNGVLTNRYGANTHYCIHERLDWGGFGEERIVKADNAWLLGEFARNDQVRGVSPLAPAVILFSQLYDSLDFALAKVKLSQLLGLVTKRHATQPFGMTDGEDDEFGTGVREKFGDSVAHLDMGVDDSVELFETKNPSNEFQSFCEQVIRLAFAALDIPYSFLDGSKTNYYGSEGEFEQYIDDCRKRQEYKLEFLREMTVRVLEDAIAAGLLDDAIRAGYDAETLADCCTWTGASIPIWRMLKYIKEYNLALNAGLLDPYGICEMHDLDFPDNIHKIRQAQELARGAEGEAEVKLSWNVQEEQTVNVGL